MPAPNKASIAKPNTHQSYQPIIIATWYKANEMEQIMYAKMRPRDFKNEYPNPRKKNSSKKELIIEIYKATKMKLLAFTPTESFKLVVILEKSMSALNKK